MKKASVALIIFLFVNFFYAQKTEFRIYFHGNRFHFTGNSAEKSTFLVTSDYSGESYTNNPHGKESDLGFGISLNVKQVAKNNIIFGADLGYENLNSKINVTNINTIGGIKEATGKTNIVYNNINFFGFLGYRIPAGKINIDVAAGADVGFILSGKEKQDVSDSYGNSYNNTIDRKSISTDFRPRLQVDAYYKKIGIYFGYSFGTPNYMRNYVGGNPEVYSEILRFGVSYLLK